MSSDSLGRIEAQLAAIRDEMRESRHVRPAAVSLSDAAKMLSVSPDHITKMVKNGTLVPRDLDGARRIPVSQIYALLDAPPQAKSSGATKERTRYDAAAASEKLRLLRKRR